MSVGSPLTGSSTSKRGSYREEVLDDCDEFVDAPYDDADLLLKYLATKSCNKLIVRETEIYTFDLGAGKWYIGKYIHNSDLEVWIEHLNIILN